MADSRLTVGSNLAPTARPTGTPARSEAVRAAQRAFFDAALRQPGTPAPAASTTRPAQAAAIQADAPVPPARGPAEPAAADLEARPSRLLRPGSLVDIRV